jgi:acyl-CoA thioesterase-2
VPDQTTDRAADRAADAAALPDRILETLDGLLHALTLDPVGENRFRVAAEPGRFPRIFGGQTFAQALLAGAATVEPEKTPQSLHALFVEGGIPEQAVDLAVERVRDGRSMSSRRITVAQGDRTLLVAIASFHVNPETPELRFPPPAVAPPEDTPRLQDWALALPDDWYERSRSWVTTPPPLDIRMAEAPRFFDGPDATGTRSHWMRVPRPVGDDPLLHAALLAYASDYFLLDMLFRDHPDRGDVTKLGGTSLDHTVWFHRPVRFDGWHLHTQETLALTGHRGLIRGSFHDAAGNLVASVAQEGLVRPGRW